MIVFTHFMSDIRHVFKRKETMGLKTFRQSDDRAGPGIAACAENLQKLYEYVSLEGCGSYTRKAVSDAVSLSLRFNLMRAKLDYNQCRASSARSLRYCSHANHCLSQCPVMAAATAPAAGHQ